MFTFAKHIFSLTVLEKNVKELSSLWCRLHWHCIGMTDFNLGHNFFVIQDIFMKLHILIHHHKGYILTKGNNSKIFLFELCPFFYLGNWQSSFGLCMQGYYLGQIFVEI